MTTKTLPADARAGALHTGNSITDHDGRTWTVGQQLGRGLWATSWVLRSGDGRECVLKTPLCSADFPADAALPEDLVDVCHTCFDEQVALLLQAALPFLPRLDGRFDLPDGRPAVLLPRYGTSVEKQIRAGYSIRKLLGLMVQVARALEAAGRVHGNLRPSNILINERGEPVLTDLLTPTAARHRDRLARFVHAEDMVPPEANHTTNPGWDTWALCHVLYRALLTTPSEEAPRREDRVVLPPSGLDKMDLAQIKDRAMDRLKQEQTNPRFVGRVTDRLASLLNRGLSQQTDPSPPFRFRTMSAFRERLSEAAALVSPRVEEVGRVLLSAAAHNAVFEGGDLIGFAVTVGTSAGVTDHEDVVCGVQVRDIDTDGDGRIRCPDLRYSVSRHPSGRLRFKFEIPDVPPGRYTVRVAFAIKDGGMEPVVAEGEFEVRPPPGYVPPAEDPEELADTPITFPGHSNDEPSVATLEAPDPVAASRADADAVAETDDFVDPMSDPGGEVIEGIFPRPIAPSRSGPRISAAPGVQPSSPGNTPSPLSPMGLVETVEVQVEPTVAGPSTQPPPTHPALATPNATVRPQIKAPRPAPVARASKAPMPRPSISMPSPAGDPDTRPAPTPAAGSPRIAMPQPKATSPGLPTPQPAALPTPDAAQQGWNSPGIWESLPDPEPEVDLELDPFFSGMGGEELPTWEVERPGAEPGEWLEYALQLLRRDSYTAVMVGTSACMGVLVVLMLALKACS